MASKPTIKEIKIKPILDEKVLKKSKQELSNLSDSIIETLFGEEYSDALNEYNEQIDLLTKDFESLQQSKNKLIESGLDENSPEIQKLNDLINQQRQGLFDLTGNEEYKKESPIGDAIKDSLGDLGGHILDTFFPGASSLASFGDVLTDLAKKAWDAIVDIAKDAWSDIQEAATYSSSSKLYSSSTTQLKLQYGFSDAEAYAYSQANKITGASGLEDLALMTESQKRYYENMYNQFLDEYEKLEDDGTLETVQDIQLEFEQFGRAVKFKFIDFISDNQDVIENFLNVSLKFFDVALPAISTILDFLNDLVDAVTDDHSASINIVNSEVTKAVGGLDLIQTFNAF